MTADIDVDAGKTPGSGLGVRHVITALLFLGTTCGYASRVSMSVAILAMTEENEHGFEVFDWDRSHKDMILSSFFWGYVVLQVPAGLAAARLGGKTPAFLAILSNGVLNLLVPLAATYGGWIAVIVCRVLMGLGQGLLYPSLHGLLGRWAPRAERSRMGTIVYCGAQVGTIIEMMVSGVLSASSWGWPSVFYTTGVAGVAWAALWLAVGSSSPADSRWISDEERQYIEMNCGGHDEEERKGLRTPWKKIWTSLPFLSVVLAHAGQSLGFWTLLTEMPTYMKNVLNVDIKNSALYSALPYIAMCLLSFVFSWLADLLVNRGVLGVTASRKLFNTIAFWGPALALLGLCYLPREHELLAVALLTATVGLNGAHFVGFLISHIDLSPNYASTLMGITNGIGNVFSIMAPLSVTLVVKDETDAAEWRNVFFISIAFYFLSNLFYIIFMVAEVQPWNDPNPTNNLEIGTKKKGLTNETRRRPSIGDNQFN
ncbi:putative inorganic phosphate cotransporter [Plutella xylostella]|uniref:putative inorganic phosphate cotransporter n=1 Tax=Plutella xylostella TaxID=51655 RepID=UPI0020330C3B|nr:putative inorganic phosphate cotransporter [Plutella xylostella]